MRQTIWKLQNPIKNYPWGCHNALTTRFNIANPEHLPQAEIWMGIHPAGTSTAIDIQGRQISLSELIKKDPMSILGASTYHRYQTLPYLFKVLAVESALSIQVHPNCEKAKAGFERENKLNIALDSPLRNFKDPNAKPELIYALTPFWAMNGFRPVHEILTLFQKLSLHAVQAALNDFIKASSDLGLRSFCAYLLSLDHELKKAAITELLSKQQRLFAPCICAALNELSKWHPCDIGIFAPLLLNVIELQPGQAMFLSAQTPHAYLKGIGLEIMGNSDNVLRAGLTNKHVNLDAFLCNTLFQSVAVQDLLTLPIKHKNRLCFNVPVSDFAFEIILSETTPHAQEIGSAEILFCIEGDVTVSTKTAKFVITSGESVFIAQSAQSFRYQGDGLLARAFCH